MTETLVAHLRYRVVPLIIACSLIAAVPQPTAIVSGSTRPSPTSEVAGHRGVQTSFDLTPDTDALARARLLDAANIPSRPRTIDGSGEATPNLYRNAIDDRRTNDLSYRSPRKIAAGFRLKLDNDDGTFGAVGPVAKAVANLLAAD